MVEVEAVEDSRAHINFGRDDSEEAVQKKPDIAAQFVPLQLSFYSVN